MRFKPLQLAVLIIVSVVALIICAITVIAVIDVIRYGGPGGVGANVPASVASSEPAQRGAVIYQRRCAGCHSTDGSARVGPTYRGLYGSDVQLEDGGTVVADEAYLRESIRDPSAKIVAGFPKAMPAFDKLSDQDVDDLIAFIRSVD